MLGHVIEDDVRERFCLEHQVSNFEVSCRPDPSPLDVVNENLVAEIFNIHVLVLFRHREQEVGIVVVVKIDFANFLHQFRGLFLFFFDSSGSSCLLLFVLVVDFSSSFCILQRLKIF